MSAGLLTCIRHILYTSWKPKRGQRVEKTRSVSSSWSSLPCPPCICRARPDQLVPSRPRWQHFFRAVITTPETVTSEQPAKHWRPHVLALRGLLSPLSHESGPDTPEEKRWQKWRQRVPLLRSWVQRHYWQNSFLMTSPGCSLAADVKK